MSKAVLVIDDEDIVREAVNDILELADLEVLEASNGVDGLAIFDENRDNIGVIMVDMKMPIMSGAEVVEHLKERNCEAPIIISSGYSEAESTQQFTGQDSISFLQKPYDIDDLTNKVMSVMGTD